MLLVIALVAFGVLILFTAWAVLCVMMSMRHTTEAHKHTYSARQFREMAVDYGYDEHTALADSAATLADVETDAADKQMIIARRWAKRSCMEFKN